MHLALDNPYFRLYVNAKRLAWDPESIDLTRDRESWRHIVEAYPTERYAEQLLLFCSLFHAGELSVTQTLSPFLAGIARAGLGIEREMYLTTQLFEEAKHVEFFERYRREVFGADVELPPLPGDSHRVLVEELDAAADRIRREDDPVVLRTLLVEGVTHYMGVVEGTLGRTAYRAAHEALGSRGWLPGLQAAFRLIRRDEGRHIAFGIHFVRDMVALDRRYRRVVERTFRRFLPLVQETVRAFDYPHPLTDASPLQDYALDAYVQFAAMRHQRERAVVPDQVLEPAQALDEELATAPEEGALPALAG